MTFTGRAFQRRSGMAAWDPTALSVKPWSEASGARASSGEAVDMQSALSMLTFFRGVQLIADSVALLPVNAVERRSDGSRRMITQAPDILCDPWLGFSLAEGISQLTTSLLLRGNGYPYVIDEDKRGLPSRVQILSPDQVNVGWDSKAGGRTYTVGRTVLDPSSMTHLTNFMLPGSVVGAGVIEYCRNALGLGLALDDVAGRFFRNGIMSTGVIGVDAELSPDDARAVADQFVQNHSGTARAHLPVVLGGGAKYTPISLSPDDAQFIQSRQFQQGEIATLLGIPPHLLGIVDRTTSWGTGIEVQGRAYVDYTLRPFIERLQRMFSSWLPDGIEAEFDTDALTRADTATRYQNYNVALVSGFLSVNEVRAMEREKGIGPLGDTYYAPQLSVPAQKALENSASNNPAQGDPNAPGSDTQGDGSDGSSSTD